MVFWAGRKAAFPAVGRISPDYYCMDGTIPRRQLPYVLRRMQELADFHALRVANVFHAGDGNLHPLILYDATRPASWSARKLSGPISCGFAWRWAASSPANTAWAWRSAT
jgi:glycolate oxidase